VSHGVGDHSVGELDGLLAVKIGKEVDLPATKAAVAEACLARAKDHFTRPPNSNPEGSSPADTREDNRARSRCASFHR
jgi:hypothetical protein